MRHSGGYSDMQCICTSRGVALHQEHMPCPTTRMSSGLLGHLPLDTPLPHSFVSQGPFFYVLISIANLTDTPTELLLPSRQVRCDFLLSRPVWVHRLLTRLKTSFPFSRKSSSSAWLGPGPLLMSPPSQSKSQNTQTYQGNGMPPQRPITQRKNTKVLRLASSRIQPPTRCFRRLQFRHARVRYLIL